MQIVIDIPKEDYEFIYDEFADGVMPDGKSLTRTTLYAIAKGTVLPKNHGRLIDADDITQEYRKQVMVSMSEGEMLDLLIDLFEDSATVIEPYKEADNE